ncbi:LysR family transcriptional regulator [Streptomyces sp. YU58]|uniref:LysR family transcriptional regulator n=1 Tax=Streptomyces sp. SX92 TaxID=3158972 RepID=UPI0027B925F3|nr:LysR family transcriptional regulator [Streptomyces coralus]WLW58188.1 LysR family transcriptional regulator [Streptomyces coralus]
MSPGHATGGVREPSLHQLRLFLVLSEELHFGRAAARVYVTQPAFSQQIRSLEQRLGVTLVERGGRGTRLTPAGQALTEEARAVVDAMARLRQTVDRHAGTARGRLRIGSLGAEAAMPYAHAVLARLRERHPDLEIEVRNLTFVDMFGALLSGEVDAAFLRGPLPGGIQSLRLATEARVVCLSDDDPLAGRETVTLADLADRAVVDMPPEVPRSWWDHLTVNPRPDGTPARYGPVVRDTEAMVFAVTQKQAITFLPSAARHLYPRTGITYVDCPDLGLSTAELAWLPDHRDEPTVTALREAAHHILRQAQCTDPDSASHGPDYTMGKSK